MKMNFKSTAIGFVLGLGLAAGTSQAAQHAHAATAPAKPAPGPGMDQMKMMTDPAMRQQMMERMRQCHDTMSHMMEHMDQMSHESMPANKP